MSDFSKVKIDVYLVDDDCEEHQRIYSQVFHKAYVDSLPNDWLQALIAMLNKLEKINV